MSSHLPQRAQTILDPRKSPVQARSAASVNAILEATIQVLLRVGKERLTTTRVALRAGVSVGTLYQYFPNKSALLQAVVKRHLGEITEAVERVCDEQKGNTLSQMTTALINAFFAAKMKNPKTSVALYFVASDVDGAKIDALLSGRSYIRHISAERLASTYTLCNWPDGIGNTSFSLSAPARVGVPATRQELTLITLRKPSSWQAASSVLLMPATVVWCTRSGSEECTRLFGMPAAWMM